MEMSQGNSLCGYIKQAKCHFFLFLQNQRTGGWNRSCVGVGISTSGRGRWWGKGVGGEYGVNGKIYLLKLFQEWGEGNIKEKQRG
jgi:hypothetical protein